MDSPKILLIKSPTNERLDIDDEGSDTRVQLELSLEESLGKLLSDIQSIQLNKGFFCRLFRHFDPLLAN